MSIVPNRYPLDLTGLSIDNLVLAEVHTPPIRLVRSIAPLYGPYYSDSLKVYNNETNELLIRGVNYTCLDVIGLPTAQSGKEICAIIALIDQSVSGVKINYQSLGGGYSKRYEAIRLLMEAVTSDNRPVSWPNVTNRPSGYASNMHLHSAGDVIGFEYLIAALEQLKNAILMGDEVTHSEILTYVDSRIDSAIGSNDVILLALSRASNANTSASNALASITDIVNTNDAMLATITNVLNESQVIMNDQVNSLAKATALLDSYNLTFPNP